MEFSIFAQGHVPRHEMEADPGAEHRRLLNNVEVTVAAEAAGIKYVWCPEHHFLTEYSHMPAPEVFLSFAAALTSTIHLGSAIFNITAKVNHPFRVAERAATLDVLSQGRFELGTGRGSSTTEVFGFDIPDLEITKEMWDEAIREIPKMFEEEPYGPFAGKFSTMPERNVLPKPWQKPHPPLWVAAGSPPTFTKAGEMGLGTFCFTLGAPERIAKLVDNYKKGIAGCQEPVGKYVNDNIMGVTNMLCFEDRNEAFDWATRIGLNYYSSLAFHWLDNIPKPPGLPEWPAVIPEPNREVVEALTANGTFVVGDPDDCARAVQKWADIGIDQLCFSPTTNTLPVEKVIESLHTFGKHVIPQFDKDEVHRTTRQREEWLAKNGA